MLDLDDVEEGAPQGLGQEIGGIFLVLIAATVTNFGLTLQKFSHMRNANKDEHNQKGVCQQPFWLLGFSLFVGGQLMSLVALGFCSQSLVATLGSFSLVTNVLFAPCFLGEKPTKMDGLSVLIIMIGSGVVVWSTSGRPSHDNYTLTQLIDLFNGVEFQVYISIILIIIVVSLLILHKPCMKQAPKGLIPAKNAGMMAAGVGASIASLSVLFAKCSVHIVKSAIDAKSAHEFTQPLTYVIISALLVCATQSVRYLNIGLQEGECLKIVPFYFVASTILTIAGGLIYFNDLKGMSTLNIAVFAVGVVVTIGGVYVASMKMISSDEVKRDSAQEEVFQPTVSVQEPITPLVTTPSPKHAMQGLNAGETEKTNERTPLIPLRGEKGRTNRPRFSYAADAYRGSFVGDQKRRYSTSVFGGLGVA